MLSAILDFLNSRPTIVALSGIGIALLGVGAAAASAWFARMQFRGSLVVFWRPREAGFTTIDIVVRNVGGGSVRSVEVTSDQPDFQSLEFAELPAVTEYCIDTMSGKSSPQEYYTRHGWARRLRWRPRRWQIDPAKFSGVQTRGVTALRKISDTLESVERIVRDSPVLRNAGNTIGISRSNEETWVLPSGVIAVLLPDDSETLRTHIQDETVLESGSRQNRPSGTSVGTHAPRDVMRVVVDPERLSPEEEKKLASYLDHGEITLHYSRQHWPTARYRILTVIDPPRGARIIERHVVYEQPAASEGDNSE